MLRSAIRAYFYTLLFIIIFFIALAYGFFSPLENIWQKTTASLSAPLFTFTQSVTRSPLFRDKVIMQKRIDTLEEQLREFHSLKSRVNVLENENNALARILEWQELRTQKYSIAKIIGRPYNAPETQLLINRGSKDNIFIGMPVIIDNNVLVGTIMKVTSETSIVRLLTDNNSIVSTKISGNSEPVGILKGEVGLSLKLDLIPITLEINTGDVVVTSGLDKNIPENLIIGTVLTDLKKSDDFFQNVSVETAYDTNRLNIVSLILNE